MGRTPNEQGNGCLLCDFFWNDMNKCDFCYYIQEQTVTGFYINKNGLWIETSQTDAQYDNKETNRFFSNLIGNQIFFDKKEAEICALNIDSDNSKENQYE